MMPVQTLKRWGNSLAVRIPASAAAKLALSEGQDVEVEVEDGTLTVRPHTAIRRFSRERYLQQLRDQQVEQSLDQALEPHPLIDFGEPKGSEIGGPDDPARFDQW
ncbi:AbrB/MazE/SpoVT family DNA-binding domain-containing protein [Paraburkholderia sp. J67]|uniref:AbrB/MazE/SpoVT family DNA-binding domain-containing protein n=1 Tax=Paraburkholderia sp. J67 TaxID=2805435 RepID=UPI002ABDD11F|nr:AbrB/MazE/SpoVT family DNA-binding domain-containing protein [Paraburkholderia sp. J67]